MVQDTKMENEGYTKLKGDQIFLKVINQHGSMKGKMESKPYPFT